MSIAQAKQTMNLSQLFHFWHFKWSNAKETNSTKMLSTIEKIYLLMDSQELGDLHRHHHHHLHRRLHLYCQRLHLDLWRRHQCRFQSRHGLELQLDLFLLCWDLHLDVFGKIKIQDKIRDKIRISILSISCLKVSHLI